MPPTVDVLPDAEALFRRAADAFARLAREAIAARGRFTVALAGGSTPRGLYRALASELETIPWDRVQVCWGDERHVPPDSADSNYRMAHETLLASVPVPDAQIHRVPTELPDVDAAARAYERTLRAVLPPTARFDLVLLGLGADAHTASLFPGSPAVAERERWVVATAARSPARVTCTPPVLNAAGAILFLVSGAAKAPALRAVLAGPRDPSRFPAQVVQPADAPVLWLVDAAAAAQLPDGVAAARR